MSELILINVAYKGHIINVAYKGGAHYVSYFCVTLYISPIWPLIFKN